jgi:hypothetical protein
MNESDLNAGSPNPDDAVRGEYQDPGYHDDDEAVDMNDVYVFRAKVPVKKMPSRRPPPPPRRYFDD